MSAVVGGAGVVAVVPALPPQPTSSDNSEPLANPRSDDNGGHWTPIIAIVLVTILAGGATYLYRLRRARQ